jgi:hypothetical protein
MEMQQIDTIRFVDADSNTEAHAFVRAGDGLVSLGLSLIEDGDIHVVLPIEICEQLVAALANGITIAKA